MGVITEAHQRGEHLLSGREDWREKGTREKGTRQRVLGKTPEDILEKHRHSRITVLPPSAGQTIITGQTAISCRTRAHSTDIQSLGPHPPSAPLKSIQSLSWLKNEPRTATDLC